MSAPAPPPSKNILFVGNPGVGKSTMLNGLIGEKKFLSGVSAGTGMTSVLQSVRNGETWYMDTPGLADIDKREQAAQEIETALKQGGNYRICFVVTTDSGRIRPADLETMSVIAKAVSVEFEYGIIINKFGNSKSLLAIQDEVVEVCLRMAETATGRRPRQVLVLHENTELKDENDVLPPPAIVGSLKTMIGALGGSDIKKEHVSKIVSDVQALAELNAKLEKEQKEAEAERAESKKRYDALSAEQKQLQDELAEMRAEANARAAQLYTFDDERCKGTAASTNKRCKNSNRCPHHKN